MCLLCSTKNNDHDHRFYREVLVSTVHMQTHGHFFHVSGELLKKHDILFAPFYSNANLIFYLVIRTLLTDCHTYVIFENLVIHQNNDG